ncbi:MULTISPECIES: ATP-binding protein [Streptomyces]|uniref:ATP-binding protein n=1 Tax=Streptomyces koelreuteriae TaxID=2838015 RepID=A0ABX8FVV4_9ACTN|nr:MULTISPECIES: ATP-binding protein [Streptomyces]QWB25324.1 ATP-binding protein [Streptomyces koelreuteriae]UUA08366.1 ATP-binding protein [Streptomyces koelreuteriae]UUA15971.1 ATP-binding protein [Streptomyces sp. CRCS-T-1]
MSRKPWELAFTAEPVEVAGLRRILRLQLGMWGLHDVVDEAQLCVSELVANVITHVGTGTPATLAVSMKGTHLRIEVHDPDTRALPVLRDASTDAEEGRGMALVEAVADRWGVLLGPDRKVTWCELATKLTVPGGHVRTPGVARAEALLDSYAAPQAPLGAGTRRMTSAVAEDTAIAAIADFLHWFRAHGRDADDMLDRAQMRFEAEHGALRQAT